MSYFNTAKENPLNTCAQRGVSGSFWEAAIKNSTLEIVAALVSYIKQLLHYNNYSECESQDSTKKVYGPRSWQHVDKGIKRFSSQNGTTPRTVRADNWNLLEKGSPSTAMAVYHAGKGGKYDLFHHPA